jgi:hypothetical protein
LYTTDGEKGIFMERELYIDGIVNKLQASFNIEKPAVENGYEFNMIARHQNTSGRIFITKSDIIDKYETFETCYLKSFDSLTLEDVTSYFCFLAEKADNINPQKDHFFTDITGIIVCETLPDNIEAHIKRMRFERTFRMLWRGFSTVRLVCVELSTGKVYTNKDAREIKKVYEF